MSKESFTMLVHELQNSTFGTVVPTFTVIFIALFYVLLRRGKTTKVSIDENVMNARLLSYKPEPLIPQNGNQTTFSKLQGRLPDESDPNCLNLAKVNFLNLLNNKDLRDSAEKSIRFYGVGPCGPRGFYGTIDVHLTLESRLAKFMNMEEAVLYSYGFSTISSAIGAYCKKSDIIFCDEKISFCSNQGVLSAKCKVEYFKHNNMADLEDKLRIYEKKEHERKKLFRKFLIVEGIYGRTGTICPLPQLMELREKYKLRIFIDESTSFGVLGKTGRGVTEHFNIDRSNVDMIMATLEGALSSIGGFCVGASYVIEHQRLSGLGYCFSASLPPYLSQVAINALDIFEETPSLFQQLEKVSVHVHNELIKLSGYEVISDSLSPVKVITTKENAKRAENIKKIRNFCVEENVYLTFSEDTLLFNINIALQHSDIERLVNVLKTAHLKL